MFWFFISTNKFSFSLLVVLLWASWSHQGRQFILSITLAQAQKRHKCLARPSVTAQLAGGLWCPVQGIHRPVGRNRRQLLHSQRRNAAIPIVAAIQRSRDLTSLHKSQHTVFLMSMNYFSCLLSFLCPCPSSSLAWFPRQMVCPGRCSPPALCAFLSKKGRTKGWIQSKQNLLEGEEQGSLQKHSECDSRNWTFCRRGIRQVGAQKRQKGKKNFNSHSYYVTISGVWHTFLMC